MRGAKWAAIAALLVLGPAACGGGDDDGGAAPEPGNRAEQIRAFGAEANGPEARRAEAVLRRYLDARASGEWGGACSQLTSGIRRALNRLAARSATMEAEGCAGVVARNTTGLSATERDDLPVSKVDSVRVDGRHGHVLYEDGSGGEYVMSIRREAGEWKVAGVTGTPLER